MAGGIGVRTLDANPTQSQEINDKQKEQMVMQGRLEQKRVSSIASVGLNNGKDNSNKQNLYLNGAKISVKMDD